MLHSLKDSFDAEFLNSSTWLQQTSFVNYSKSRIFLPRFARLCYCGKQQKSLNLVKQLACTYHKKRQFSLEALVARIRGRLGLQVHFTPDVTARVRL